MWRGHHAARIGAVAWRTWPRARLFASAANATAEPISAPEFAAAMQRMPRAERLGHVHQPECVVAAVSGGADSMALLALLAEWRATHERDTRLVAVTVDHKLRAESGDEAAQVGAWVRKLEGVDEHIVMDITWRDGVPESGVPKRARDARYARLMRACGRLHSSRLCVGHQADDQAETFVARMAHSSGVAGLAAMQPCVSLRQGVHVLRPLLAFPRARVEATCVARGVPFLSDPTNADQRFQRPRIRQALAALAESGALPHTITTDMVAVAQRARDDVHRDVEAALGRVFRPNRRFLYGYISTSALLRENAYTAQRALSRIVQHIGGSESPPRLHALQRLHWNMTEQGGGALSHTLGHTLFHPQPKRDQWLVLREIGSKHNRTVPWQPGSALWDGRYRIRLLTRRHGDDLEPLGEELHVRQLTPNDLKRKDLRYEAPWVPKRVLFTLPVLEDKHGVVAIPHLQVFARRGWFCRADVAPRTALHPSDPIATVQE